LDACLTPDEERQLKDKAEKGLQEEVNGVMAACRAHKYPFSDICPTCGKHQSWGVDKFFQKLIEVPVSVCILVTALLWMTSLLETGFSLWIIQGSTGVSLICLIIYVIWQNTNFRYHKKYSPEIDLSGK